MTKQDKINGIIKAMTAFGGDCTEYEHFWNDANIALFEKWMQAQPKVEKTMLFRGYTFDEFYYDDAGFRLGAVVGMDALTQSTLPSFTTDMLRAVGYMYQFGEVDLDNVVRVLFAIETTGKAFVNIAPYSFYKDECEHKCTSSVKLKVTSFEKKAGFFIINMIEV